MTFVFEGIIGASISLAFVYMLSVIYVSYQLYRVHHRDLEEQKSLTLENIPVDHENLRKESTTFESPKETNYNYSNRLHRNSSLGNKSTLNTKKLFIMTCLLSSLLRLMSFSSMAIFDLSAIRYSLSTSESSSSAFDDNTTGTEQFFEKAFLVLFDFPDFCFISAYCLLIVVWCEAYLQSRRHWLSSVAFRRVWIFSYLIFNICLYGCQVGLYTLLFIPTVNKGVLSTFIYLTLTAYNLVLPILWLIVYIYLAIKFAGFPYAPGNAQQRLSRLGTIVALWTVTRIGWGFVTLTTVLQGWLNVLSTTNLGHTLILVAIFLVAEVFPILYSLQSSMLGSLSESSMMSLSLIAVYNSLNQTISPNRGDSNADDIYSSSSPIPVPGDNYSRFWSSKSKVKSRLTNTDQNQYHDHCNDRMDNNDYLISLLQPRSIPMDGYTTNRNYQTNLNRSLLITNSMESNILPIDPQSHPSSLPRTHDNVLSQANSYHSDESFESAHSFPIDYDDDNNNNSRSNNSRNNIYRNSYDDNDSARSYRDRRKSSTASSWSGWIFGI